MTHHKGYKYRIYPNEAQIKLMSQFFGCCRFVYNRCLTYRKDVYVSEKRNASQYECMRLVTALRHDPEHIWLAACDSMALQESVKDLNKAFVNFFKKRGGYPKYHKKSSAQSYRTRNQSGSIRIEGNRIVLPKLGAVKAKISRLPKGRILNAAISRTATGKYFVSLCCEEELIPKPNNGGVLGLDLGIKELYVDSQGYMEPNPKYIAKYEKKLRREQRALSRMIEANIASAIHLVVQTQRGLDGMRRICEVVSFSFNRETGRCETRPVYQREIDADSGQWVSFPSWIDELSRWGVANGEEVESWKRTCCLS